MNAYAPKNRPFRKRNLEIVRSYLSGEAVISLAQRWALSRARVNQIISTAIHAHRHGRKVHRLPEDVAALLRKRTGGIAGTPLGEREWTPADVEAETLAGYWGRPHQHSGPPPAYTAYIMDEARKMSRIRRGGDDAEDW